MEVAFDGYNVYWKKRGEGLWLEISFEMIVDKVVAKRADGYGNSVTYALPFCA